jgi:C_GCAxxG_C_C family probable redox protein
MSTEERWSAAQVGAEGARIMLEGKFNCAESVLLALARGGYIESGCTPATGTPFGGGIGRKGDLCGILTGGLIAIGLRCGRAEADDLETKEKAYRLAARYYEHFDQDNEGVRCWDLTKCDLSQPEERKRFNMEGIDRQCAERLRRAVEWLAETLQEEGA